ncbi:hypothetical protein [Magnetovibrio sp.]|uniref:hypothetical protein n=1 Tax=Magnetovibrio sp. TaxID=2024836 RepID=UPI002F91ED1C
MQNPIDAVLEAEREAESETDRHRAAARKTINQALEDARVIAERTHRRISNIRTHCTASVEASCAAMWRAYRDQPKTVVDSLITPDHIANVSKRVAAKLTGARDG